MPVRRLCVDAVAYKFGRRGGLVDVSFDDHERANTRRDRVVVGFRTSVVERGDVDRRLLVRVVSATSSDFVQLSLVRRSPPLAGRAFVARTCPTRSALPPQATSFVMGRKRMKRRKRDD